MWNYTRYLLMFIICILLTVYTQGQQPSPADPCKLYAFNTGLTSLIKQFDVVINETDGVANPLQVVKVPISGRTAINLVGETPSDTTTLTKYDIQFYYNSGNGFMEMTVGKAIDRDGVDYGTNDDLDVIQFNLECQFTSGGTSARDYFEVTVRVLDSNDNPPVFVNLPYNVAIKEALPISTTVYDSISATDKDAARNKEIQFAIIGGASYAGQTYFNMPDPGVGYIMLSRSLDYEFLDQNNAKEFRLTITARDNAVTEANRRTSTSTVTITIEDSDDLTPTFSHTGCRASSTLLNSCDGVKYKATITSGIVTGGSIPVIPIVSGTENTAFSLRAFDMDKLNTPIVFEIIGSIPSGYENRFAVSTSARETDASLPGRDIYRATLTQTSSITRSETKTLFLFLKARQTDDPQKYRISEIDLTVQPSNQNNPVLTIPTGTTGFIEENVAFGTNVRASATMTPALEFLVIDADLVDGDSQSYIYSIPTPGIPFYIQSSDGPRATIYATKPLDREAVPSYTFTVRATENVTVGARSGDLQVTVLVQDVNDNTPVFTSYGYTRMIVEGDYSGVNRVLLTDSIRAYDIDAGDNGRVSYSIKNISVTSGSLTRSQILSFLTIEPNGDVYLNGALSYGLAFVATILASDNGAQIQLKATETLIVTVASQGNTPPQFPANRFTVHESEASPGGTFVLAVTASDAEDLTLAYTIQTPFIVGTSNKFTITTDGTIRVAGLSTTYPLDYETEPKYVFIVRATDSTGRTGTTTVTVDIINVNDNPPIFSSTTYTFSVDEGQANVLIGTISGGDADKDTVNYSLFNTATTSTGIFTIHSLTGEIRTTTMLDYETTKQYILVALITDNGNPSLTGFTQVTVNVNDINDNIPLFTDLIYQGYFIQGQSEVSVLRVGSDAILQVLALDADSVPRVSYKFQIELNKDFNIDANTGALTVKRALDCSVQKTYQFYVTTVEGATVASNSPNSNARAFVIINCGPRGEPSAPCKDGEKIGAGVGAGIGIAVLLVAFIIIFVKRFQTRRKKDASASIASINEQQTNNAAYTDLQRNTNTTSEYSELNFPQDGSINNRSILLHTY